MLKDKSHRLVAVAMACLLAGLAAVPVDINTASEDSISKLPNISADQARTIVANRPYASVDDLIKKTGIPAETVTKIEPLIFFSQRQNEKAGGQAGHIAEGRPRLSISDILAMLKASIPEETLVEVIQQDHVEASVSSKDIIALKGGGASNRVLEAVILSQQPVALASASPQTSPAAPLQPGLYMLSETEGESHLIDLDKSVVKLARTATFSLNGRYAFVPITQPSADTREHKPTFYLYASPIDVNSAAVEQGSFSVVRMESAQVGGVAGHRFALAGKRMSRLKPRAEKSFKVEQVRPGVYRITFDSGLRPGTYAFVFSTPTDASYSVYSFSVR
jgi:hypothetical protein